jgi:hypothetical protein
VRLTVRLLNIAQFCRRNTYEWPITIGSGAFLTPLSRYVKWTMKSRNAPSWSLEDILMPHNSGEHVKTYLFACVHNAGRSQMAAALFNLYANRRGCLAISAGTEPADHIHPKVVEVMREIGIDRSPAKPQNSRGNWPKPRRLL